MRAQDRDGGRVLLVAGSSGRIGRRMARAWRRAPPRALRPVLLSRGGASGAAWDPLEGPGAIEAHRGARAMLLLSGVVSAEEDLTLNARLALAAADACEALGIGRLLVASSSAVYGAGRGRPMAEDAPPAPVSAYGEAKLAMEEALRGREGTCCLRIGNVAGADALLAAATLATPERPLRLDRFGNGRSPRRSYVGPESFARCMEALALAPGPLPFALNVAAPRPVYMGELLEAAEVPWRHRPAPPGALQDITLDTARLAAIHEMPAAASDPAGIVAEWRRAEPAA